MNQPFAKRVAAEVRAELARQGTSQGRIAEVLGLSQSGVSRRLQGKVAFDVKELDLIAGALGVPITQFLPRDGRSALPLIAAGLAAATSAIGVTAGPITIPEGDQSQ